MAEKTLSPELLEAIERAKRGPLPSVSQFPVRRGKPPRPSGEFEVNPEFGPPPGWNYKTAPTDWEGNPLPPGAVGWTKQGEPYYGLGRIPVFGDFLEWAKTAWGRITEPTTGTGGAQLLTQGKEAGKEPTLGQKIARGTGETVRGLGEAANVGAHVLEYAAGAQEAAREAGEGGALPDITEALRERAPEIEGEGFWQDFGRAFVNYTIELNPLLVTYNATRMLLAPGTMVDKSKKAEAALQAATITYTSWMDPAIRQEFIRRYNAGEDPYLLQQELQNPIAELIGQLIFDPLNLIGIGAGKAPKIAAVAPDVTRAADAARDIVRGAGAVDEAAKIAKYQATTDAIMAQTRARQAVRAGLESRGALAAKASRPIEGFWALTATGKRVAVEQITSRAIRALFSAHTDPGDAADMLKAVVEITSDKANEVGRGVSALLGSRMGNVAFSDDMLDLGITLRRMLSNKKGVLDTKKFLGEVGEIDDYAKAVAFAEGKIVSATEGMFPTVSEMIAKGQADTVKPVWRALAWVDSKLRKPTNFINQALSYVYMGLNPGYAMRNLVQNYIHALVDMGPGIFAHRPGGWIAEATDWLGPLISKKATQGIGIVGALPGGTRKLLGFQRTAQWAERIASETVYGIAVKRAMERMLKYGKGLPDVKPLMDAGLDPRLASTIQNAILAAKGNVPAALKMLRGQLRTGSVDAFRALEWASPSLVKRLRAYPVGTDNLFEAIQKALAYPASQEDAMKALDKILAGFREEAAKLGKEGISLDVDRLDRLESGLIQAIQDAKGVEDKEAAVLLNAIKETAHVAVEEYMTALGQYAKTDPRFSELVTRMGARWREARELAADNRAAAWKEWDLMKLAANAERRTLSGSDEAIQFWELVRRNFMDIFKSAREEIAEVGERAAADMTGNPAVDRALAAARASNEQARLWDGANYTNELGWFVGEGKNVTKLVPPYVAGTAPTRPRSIAETLPAVERILGDVQKGLTKHWGETVDVVLDEKLETAIVQWGEEATRRVNEARQIANQTGEAARDFCLLDYTKKKGIDLALGYVFPYQFWYNRTYQNWIRRFIRNPVILADYAKYRRTLEQIHAGAPDWWKYNVNTNELLGLDWEEPLYFNLEALLNPLNGITGVDFDDPAKRVDWWTATIDSIGRFGPSVWTPISLATAVSLYTRGETEAAARWAGRLIPQTASLKSAISLIRGKVSDLPLQGEFDPAVQFFSGGLDPYERKRVARALGFLIEEGEVSEDDALEAGYTQEGDVWNLALDRAINERAPGQLMSFIGGVGLKARSQSDMQIDKFWADYNRLWNLEPNMSPEEFQEAMGDIRTAYPFMDAVLLSRKSGVERDRSYAYNILGRIAPGDKYELAQLADIPDALLDRFYDEKGHLEDWSMSDRQRFMAGILDLGALLDVPNDATRDEWTDASSAYKEILEQMRTRFGDDIEDRIDAYYRAKGETQADRDRAEAILSADPQIGYALDFKSLSVMSNPLTARYYSSISQIETYWNGQMYEDIRRRLGEDIWDKWDEYWGLRDAGEDYRGYYRAHPELKEYGKIKDEWQPIIARNILDFGEMLSKRPYSLRTTTGESYGQRAILEGLEGMGAGLPDYSWEEWQQTLGGSLSNLVVDYVALGEELPASAMTKLEEIAEEMGLGNGYVILELAARSMSR